MTVVFTGVSPQLMTVVFTGVYAQLMAVVFTGVSPQLMAVVFTGDSPQLMAVVFTGVSPQLMTVVFTGVSSRLMTVGFTGVSPRLMAVVVPFKDSALYYLMQLSQYETQYVRNEYFGQLLMHIGPIIWELVPPNIRNLEAGTAFQRAIKDGNWKTALVESARRIYRKLVLFSSKLWHTKNYRLI